MSDELAKTGELYMSARDALLQAHTELAAVVQILQSNEGQPVLDRALPVTRMLLARNLTNDALRDMEQAQVERHRYAARIFRGPQ